MKSILRVQRPKKKKREPWAALKERGGVLGRSSTTTPTPEALTSTDGARGFGVQHPQKSPEPSLSLAGVKRPPFVRGQHKQAPDGARSVGWEAKKAPGGSPGRELEHQCGGPLHLTLRGHVLAGAHARRHVHARMRTQM